jgi:hypothetical protein
VGRKGRDQLERPSIPMVNAAASMYTPELRLLVPTEMLFC